MFDKKVINHDDIIDEKVAKLQLYQTYYLIAYLPTHLKQANVLLMEAVIYKYFVSFPSCSALATSRRM